MRPGSLSASPFSYLCFLKQRSWGWEPAPDSSLSVLLRVRTSAHGRSTACRPPTSPHGKPGWALCHTLTKVAFTSRLLKGHSTTPGAAGDEEGEGAFLSSFSFLSFFFNLLLSLEKYTLSLLLCCPSLSTHTGTFSF